MLLPQAVGVCGYALNSHTRPPGQARFTPSLGGVYAHLLVQGFVDEGHAPTHALRPLLTSVALPADRVSVSFMRRVTDEHSTISVLTRIELHATDVTEDDGFLKISQVTDPTRGRLATISSATGVL